MKIADYNIHTRVTSLIRLTEDPDPHVFNHVKNELVQMGDGVVSTLEQSWCNHDTDEEHRNRIFQIIREIQVNDIKADLEKWRESSIRDLLRGSLIISRFQFPDVDFDLVDAELEKIKQKVWLEINEEHTAFEIVKIFNHVLFDLCGFQSSENNFYTPQNSFINTVLESKKGNQLSLSILYSVIAQKLQIPIFGIDMPNNFILGFMDEFQTLKMLGLDKFGRNVLFYINPFSKGRIFDQNEIENYLRSHKLPLSDNYFVPCSNSDILKRMIDNLVYAYQKVGETKKVEELKEIRLILV
ncbi:transglutaminase-like domain-containing protein [Crocinitomix sp.]|nr:transglutaminase-like domain-containing protein [Crocinitomix sp.]